MISENEPWFRSYQPRQNQTLRPLPRCHDKLVRKLLPFSSWLRLLSSTEDRP
jgi:hypothetical protein